MPFFLQGCLIWNSSGVPPVIPEIRRTGRNGSYSFAVTQNAVHDAEGLPEIWMPRVLQRIKSTTEQTSCLEKKKCIFQKTLRHFQLNWVSHIQKEKSLFFFVGRQVRWQHLTNFQSCTVCCPGMSGATETPSASDESRDLGLHPVPDTANDPWAGAQQSCNFPTKKCFFFFFFNPRKKFRGKWVTDSVINWISPEENHVFV